jgi:thioredoxin 1
MGNALNVSQDTFDRDVIEHSKSEPVLVDFWATWCGPCKMIAPEVEQIAAEYRGRLRVVKVDADASIDVMTAYDIMSIPTLILFRDGRDVARVTGYMPKEQLLARFRPHLEGRA